MKNFIATLFVFLVSVGMVDAAQYLQASSTITQCPGTAPDVVKNGYHGCGQWRHHGQQQDHRE